MYLVCCYHIDVIPSATAYMNSKYNVADLVVEWPRINPVAFSTLNMHRILFFSTVIFPAHEQER